jgi:Putative Na+/H+ antiporter
MREVDVLNLIGTAIFFIAIVHTLLAARFTALAVRVQQRCDARRLAAGLDPGPSILAEIVHFVGEVEVIFALWVLPLMIVFVAARGWDAMTHYLNDTVTYTEALFVVVIMVLASTRPILSLAEASLQRIATLGRCTPAAWWLTILTVGPLLGSFITEPAAMTICALLLARQFYDLGPSNRLKYATLGLLFVNVSIGGTLTHFAAPPVLMVARPWNWDTGFMLSHFGWRAALSMAISTALYFVFFRREFADLALRAPVPDIEQPSEDVPVTGVALLRIPAWVTIVHLGFMAWTVVTAHYPALFIGSFLFFLGFSKATAPYQSLLDLKSPMLVGFFLAGLVIHGGLQGWWIGPLLARLSEAPLFLGSALLTAFNDNALITYLGTLVPGLDEARRIALVEGAVVGGGLTVIANAPNPAGQALLARFFEGAIRPLFLMAGALPPTLIATVVFRLF